MDLSNEQLYFAPPLPPTTTTAAADSEMEGAEDTAGATSPPHWQPPPPPPVWNHRNSPAHQAPPAFVSVADRSSPVPAPLSPVAQMIMNNQPPPPPPVAPVSRTAAEDSEEEDEDDDRSHVGDDRATSFYPFQQDTTSPDAEELRIMRGSVENSAVDDKHWQSRTFFDLQDPDFTPGEQGKIEWVIKDFNGTKDNPRKDLLLTSQIVTIGGHEWRIKLLPHGNVHTDRLSLYVENVSVQSLAPEEWPEDKLPLPAIGHGNTKVMKRRAVAAQLSILIYNPEEPRVNEFRADAHHFCQESPDHGWARFTSVPWYEIHRRSYAQRQPLLRNDTLAVKAFVRVVNDPTGCLWATKGSKKLSVTGLNPFFSGYEDSALLPVLALWLHLRSFRQVLYQLGSLDLITKEDDNIVAVLQAMLWCMRSRTVPPSETGHMALVSEFLEDIYEDKGSQDAMQTMNTILNDMSACLQDKEEALERLQRLFGNNQFSGDRLTKRSIVGKTSMQEVVDGDFPPALLQNEVLTIELERQVFDSKKRVWKKLLDKVRLDDQITIGQVTYTLHGFVAHEGHLRTGKYSSFFRPGGIGGLWYTYKQLLPLCQTRTQAVSSREGVLPAEAIEEPVVTSDRPVNYDRLLGQVDAVAYVVVYVRNDIDAFNLAAKEPWDVPKWISDTSDARSAGTTEATGNGELHYDDAASDNEDAEMNDATESWTAQANEVGTSLKKVTINYLSEPFYEGTVNSSNEYHGSGHLIYLNGDEYTGTFSSSLRSGYGTMLYANSDTYTGNWLNNLHHGNGTYTEHRTGNIYTGNWEEGKKSGTGTTYWKCSEEESKMCRICFCSEADAAFYDCGHVVACIGCARRVEDCPVCRRRIRDVIRLFYTA